MTMTQATRRPSELVARAAPTHLNGSEVEVVVAHTPLPLYVMSEAAWAAGMVSGWLEA
jgi:hypothetical protein